MSRKFRFAFGSPPFHVLADHMIRDDDFAHDAKRILDISQDHFELLARQLAGVTSFLDRRRLEAEVTAVLGNGTDTLKICRTIWQLSVMLRDSDEPVVECMDLLRTKILEKMTEVGDEQQRQTLAIRIELLTAVPPGFDRQFKAQKLSEGSGIELDDLRVLCDIRPVFGSDRTVVEGAIVVTTMRLDLDNNGISSSVDIRLTEEQLHDLFEKVTFAESKIAAIKQLLASKSIDVAATPGAINEKESE